MLALMAVPQSLPTRPHALSRAALFLVPLILLVTALSVNWGPVPALGRLIDPYHGVWAHRLSNFETAGSGSHELKVPGLHGKVEVVVDQDQIKHIFASNDEDLYFAQGYVLASDRLWQMEFSTRAASGRLSEVMGPRALKFDEFFLRMGLLEASTKSAELMLLDPVTGPALRAYANGVNAYIHQMKPTQLPVEYVILGNQPETWAPEKAALLLKFMAWSLSGHNQELLLSRTRARLGKTAFDTLFPIDIEVPEPIVPKGAGKWGHHARMPDAPKEDFEPKVGDIRPLPTPHPGNGSNNCAVTGKKSTTGLPILSNDIHLNLSVPSLWYEMQLVSPTQNVYGIAMPGAPGIILGFNSRVAWAVTNGETDVLDWYEIRYRDDRRNEYVFDGDWRPVISRPHVIYVRGEKPHTIMLRETHIGPIVYDTNEEPISASIPRGMAMHWAALEASNELKTFILINRAKTTTECRSAMEYFNTPTQNFICADNSNDVGIWEMGHYPLRWPGQGRLISDGAHSDAEWKGWVPRDDVPSMRNPERGFVSSANQPPAVPGDYPYYLGYNYERPYRALRINELLREKAKLSPEDFMNMQKDTLSIGARMLLPLLLAGLDEVETKKAFSPKDDVQKRALEILKAWDYRFDPESKGAVIYRSWMKTFTATVWNPRLPEGGNYQLPSLWRTMQLMKDPQSKWFDDPSTEKKETLTDLVRGSFAKSLDNLKTETGFSSPEQWRWAHYRPTEFNHLGKIPGLGDTGIKAGGVDDAIFANSGDHGPVWKLVVAVGAGANKGPRAWAVFPGGQSGDPLSRHYDDFIQPWSIGAMKEVSFMLDPKSANPREHSRWTLDGETK